MFFQPIFNVADASLCVSVAILILFYAKYLSSLDETTTQNEDLPADEKMD